MKKHSFFGIAMLGLASVIFSGCDKVNELDDVQFHSEFEESVPLVDASVSNTEKDYKEDITFDATDDAEINKYKSKIKSFKIDELSYVIDNSPNPTTGAKFSGILGFSASDGSAATVLATLTDVNLDDTAEHVLTLDQADLDKIAGYLTTNKAVKIYIDGKISKTPINIMVNVKIKATVTANAL